jgi:hypothetical protein
LPIIGPLTQAADNQPLPDVTQIESKEYQLSDKAPFLARSVSCAVIMAFDLKMKNHTEGARCCGDSDLEQSGVFKDGTNFRWRKPARGTLNDVESILFVTRMASTGFVLTSDV